MIQHEYWRTWASGLPDALINLMGTHDQPGQGTINTPIDTRAQLIARGAYRGQLYRMCLENYGHVPDPDTVNQVWADLADHEYGPIVREERERVAGAAVVGGTNLECDPPSDPAVWTPTVFSWDGLRFEEVGELDLNPTPGAGTYIIAHRYHDGDTYGIPSPFLTISQP